MLAVTMALADAADLAAETASVEVSWVTVEGVSKRLPRHAISGLSYYRVPARRKCKVSPNRRLSCRPELDIPGS
jgi:hypothetical protein